MAERVAKLFSAESVYCSCHRLSSVLRNCVAVPEAYASSRPYRSGDSEIVSPVKLFKRAPYLAMIVMLVMAGTSSATMLDYIFKAAASTKYDKGADLLRFFALFYIFTQILTFLAQTFLAQKALRRVGIGRTVSALPLGVGAGALGALLFPLFPCSRQSGRWSLCCADPSSDRRTSCFIRPSPKSEKRAAKTLIDVVSDRAGDALGSGVVQLLSVGRTLGYNVELLGIALALSATGIWISLRIDRGYTRLVQQRLVDRAVEFDLGDIQDFTTRSVLTPFRPAAFPQPATPPNISTASAARNRCNHPRDPRASIRRQPARYWRGQRHHQAYSRDCDPIIAPSCLG